MKIIIEPMTAHAFAPFGDLLEAKGMPNKIINQGLCGRFHDRAFLTDAGQAINIHRGVWHGVLTPLYDPGLFAVIDRIGDGPNLEEYWLPDEVIIATS